MPHYNITINQFNSGEISDRADARTDLNAYASGAKKMRNMLPLPEGQVTRIPGTEYLGEVSDSSERTLFAEFKFSEDDAYILEFGDLYMRVWQQNGFPVVDASGNVYELVTPYATADLFDSAGRSKFDFEQSANTVYIVHEDYAPRALVRTSILNWTISEVNFIDGPYESENGTATTLTAAATSGSGITVTASAATFASTDVGRLIRIGHSNEWGYGQIASFVSSTEVTIDIESTLFATTATVSWRLGLYGTVNGFPSCVTFVQDRLVFAGLPSAQFSERFDMSRVGVYTDFAPNELPESGSGSWLVTDATAIARSVTGDVNAIRWLADDRRGLIIGTSGGIWLVSPSNRNEAITAANINAVRTSKLGTARYLKAVRANDTLVHTQRFGKRVREIAYSFENESMTNTDLTRLSEQISRDNPIIDIAYQQTPAPIVWCVHQDGSLSSMLYSPEEEIVGWAQHPKQNAIYEQVSVIPNSSDEFDQVWFIVRRTVNSATVRYIERLGDIWEEGDDRVDAKYVDCYKSSSASGTPSSLIGGWTHLAGEDISLLVSGAVHPPKTVSGSGQISLDYDYNGVVTGGLPYTSEIETLDLFVEQQTGASLLYNSRITKAVAKVWETFGGEYGVPGDCDEPLILRDALDGDLENFPALTTGRIELESPQDDWGLDSRLCISISDPAALTIAALYIRLEVADE